MKRNSALHEKKIGRWSNRFCVQVYVEHASFNYRITIDQVTSKCTRPHYLEVRSTLNRVDVKVIRDSVNSRTLANRYMCQNERKLKSYKLLKLPAIVQLPVLEDCELFPVSHLYVIGYFILQSCVKCNHRLPRHGPMSVNVTSSVWSKSPFQISPALN